MEEVKPAYAQGFYIMHMGVTNMVIIFDYIDKGQYYYRLLKKGGEELASEISTLWDNMQKFMDEEIVKINGERVKPVVVDVSIGLRGAPTRPYVEFLGYFPSPLREGENIYENYYGEERAEYDYEAVWLLPRGAEIIEWNFKGRVEVPEPYILRLYVSKGTEVGGRESIKFRLKL
ncbi:MAG: hypothetical protein QXK71_05610 [Pyrobaculum sp.]|jgi:hypothetical protein